MTLRRFLYKLLVKKPLGAFGAVILTASGLGRTFSTRTRWHRVPQLLLGTVFAGLAAKLALDERR